MSACEFQMNSWYGYRTKFEAPPGFRHTHTEDVEAESLCRCFADQLIWKAVKPHMATELQSSLLFILRNYNENKTIFILC